MDIIAYLEVVHAQLAEADRENQRLRAELVEARRSADLAAGRGS